ncbi:MAG: hypothetical protein BJ554DRAFT_2190 [Olpidium bornovanus]|uniref:Uncharacterized protein n=1 Tax=Olpidium bornovanus TaxID=278681 RepID=A0A8H7ZQW0_9FUNG|nr:MAG: hypothetical protein BJ554DRAFT_2190 [Olpidium bornovanus]
MKRKRTAFHVACVAGAIEGHAEGTTTAVLAKSLRVNLKSQESRCAVALHWHMVPDAHWFFSSQPTNARVWTASKANEPVTAVVIDWCAQVGC